MRILHFSLSFFSIIFLLSVLSCQKVSDNIIEDYSTSSDQIDLDIELSTGRVIPASFNKPSGKKMDVVLVLPEEGNYQLEDQIARRYFERGYMVLRLDHNAFFGLNGAEQATLATIDFIKRDLKKYNIDLGKLILQASFKSASQAFLTALETQVDAIIISEPTTDNDIWREAQNEEKLAELKAPFLLISSEDKPANVQEKLNNLETTYHNCKPCQEGSQFVYHPGTPEEWNQDMIWELIFEFLDE